VRTWNLIFLKEFSVSDPQTVVPLHGVLCAANLY
jgi:hypothetical protein